MCNTASYVTFVIKGHVWACHQQSQDFDIDVETDIQLFVTTISSLWHYQCSQLDEMYTYD